MKTWINSAGGEINLDFFSKLLFFQLLFLASRDVLGMQMGFEQVEKRTWLKLHCGGKSSKWLHAAKSPIRDTGEEKTLLYLCFSRPLKQN